MNANSITMRNLVFTIVILSFLAACSDKKAPDVSGIKIDLKVNRFEQDFFSIDTNNIAASFNKLSQKYPTFLSDYLGNILGLPPMNDTSFEAFEAVKQFIRDYKPVKDSADKIFKNFDAYAKELEQGLKYVKHYFPDYKTPPVINTFIGPMDAYYMAPLGGYGDVMTSEGLASGLQLHLGAKASIYHSQMGEALYPNYISKRFTPETIVVNNMKNIIDDIYPEKLGGKAMVEQMVEKGKRLYVLDKLLPNTADTLKIGYSSNQLKGCYSNEGSIWNFFLTNNFLYNNEQAILKNYLSESPNTQELGPNAPGFIGLFVGWHIVKKYMEKHEDMPLMQLLQTDARKIFEESKYRPK